MLKFKSLAMVVVFSVLLVVTITTESRAQGWFELGTGSNALKANVCAYAICSDDSDNVYVGGDFTDSPSSHSGKRYVAKWSSSRRTWEMLGTGSNALNANGTISTMCVDKLGNVYAAGSFSDGIISGMGYRYVAKWDGTRWRPLGTGSSALRVFGVINSICVDDSLNVYAAGNFINATGYKYVAKWDGTRWMELSGLNANCNINTICIDDSFNVYAGGCFTDGFGRTYVAKWRKYDSTWVELGSGFDSAWTNDIDIRSSFSDSANRVCFAVNFQDTIGNTTSNVFKWNGASWCQLGALNGNQHLRAISLGDSGCIYAGGAFTNSAGKKYVARYDPRTGNWSELGNLNPHSAIMSPVSITTVYADKHNHVYATGSFTDTNDHFFVAAYGLAYLNVTDEIERGEMASAFPNPVNSILYFEIPLPIAIGSESNIRIMDITGRVVAQQPVHGELRGGVDVKGFSPGMYIYQVSTGKKVWTGKILVQ